MEKVKAKSLGQYFTPRIVAEFMVSRITKPSNAAVLEPCAGKGVFLDVLHKRGFSSVDAYEIDDGLENISPIPIKYVDFLSVSDAKKYDVIIGNPPYVRWKNLPANVRESLKASPSWKDKINGLSDLLYTFLYSSVDRLSDDGELIFITPIFWMQTLHASNLRRYMQERGVIDFILTLDEMKIFDEVSSSVVIFKFTKTKERSPLRVVHVWSKDKLTSEVLERANDMLERLVKEDVIRENEFEAFSHRQFENGQSWNPLPQDVSRIIQRIEDSCKTKWPKVNVDERGEKGQVSLSMLLDTEDLRERNLNPGSLRKVKLNGRVYYLPGEESRSISEFEAGPRRTQEGDRHTRRLRYTRLGDIVDIGNGMVSGLDKAFQISDPGAFGEEKQKFIPVVKAKSLSKYFHKGETPYAFVNDVPSEDILKERYPKIFSQLSRYRNRLEDRYDYARDIPWWHWVFLRNKALMENNDEKIFVPCKERIDKKGYVRFSLVRGPTYATQDVTAMAKKAPFKEDIRYILAILNSDTIFMWIKHKGLRRGGVVEFSERPLSSIPIRLVNWEDPQEIRLHDEIVELVDEICNSKDARGNNTSVERRIRLLYGV